jgi:hypothetical protein
MQGLVSYRTADLMASLYRIDSTTLGIAATKAASQILLGALELGLPT